MPVFAESSFYTAESLPDVVTGLASADGSLWVIGSDSYEVWRNNNDQDDPLSPIGGNAGEIGCTQPNTIATIDNVVYWLGASKLGVGGVYAGRGTEAVRISNPGIDYLLSQLSNLNSFGFCFGDEGNTYYQLSFTDSGETLLYSKGNGWSEKNYITSNGTVKSASNVYPFVWGPRLFSLCLYTNGIYELDRTLAKDYDGRPIKRQRVAPIIASDILSTIVVSSITLDIETGTTYRYDAEPKVLLRVSRDGGNTWQAWREKGLGLSGNYKKTVAFNVGGASKALVYEIVVQDAYVTPSLFGARLDYTVQTY
jgi:hypothetical protein